MRRRLAARGGGVDGMKAIFGVVSLLVALAMVVDHVSAVWDRLRDKPPAGQLYATRTELREVHSRVDILLKTVGDSIEELKSAVNEELKEARTEAGEITKSLASIHRALGRLEGHNDGGNHHG